MIYSKEEIQEQINEAKNEGLTPYLMFGKVRINNPDGDDYYYYDD